MKWKSRRVSPHPQHFKKKALIIIYLFLFVDGGETLNLGFFNFQEPDNSDFLM